MALREFTAEDGRAWRTWDILPDQLDHRTRAEDYLQGFLDGWLVFESKDGRDKCRLYPIPANWVTRSEEELRLLLRAAEPVRGERLHPSADDSAVPGTPTAPRESVRTFRYPGGRFWTVREWLVEESDQEGETQTRRVVLRFAAGARRLDLLAFPRNWEKYTDKQLADLLYIGFPRDASRPNPTTKARRRGDRSTTAS